MDTQDHDTAFNINPRFAPPGTGFETAPLHAIPDEEKDWAPWARGTVSEQLCRFAVPGWYPKDLCPMLEMRLRMVLSLVRIAEQAVNDRVMLSSMTAAMRSFQQICLELQAAAENQKQSGEGGETGGSGGGKVSGKADTKELNSLRSEKSGHGLPQASPPPSSAQASPLSGEAGAAPKLTRQQRRRLDRQLEKAHARLERQTGA